MALPFNSSSPDSNNDSQGSPGSDFHIVTAQDVNSPTLGSHLETPELGLPNPDADTDSRTELCGSILEELYKAKMGKPSKDDARKKAQSLSLIEQVSLLCGCDNWRTVKIPEKGVADIKTTDGPNGARGDTFKGGTRAALFPCGVSLAATWDVDLIHEIGEHLAQEVKSKRAHVLLAPTVCLHRGPLGGRNFESYSEDPLLTGKVAASYINGLQGKGVAACIKHFVCNEQETERLHSNSVVPERALRELYLRPFEIAVREANPWALMSSYNLINGTHADMNTHTLKDILRGEWKWDGMVMSDWTGVNSVAESIEAGCDLEMPHSDKWRHEKAIQAIKDGSLSVQAVEDAATNVLYLIQRCRGDDTSDEKPEKEDNRAETRELIRKAGAQGIVLLKNEKNILPLDAEKTKIAVIGPNGNRAVAGGGGSASLNPYYNTIPLDSIRKASKQDVTFAQGCEVFKWVPVATPFCSAQDGTAGATLEFFIGDKFEGKPAVVQHKDTTDLMLWDSAPKSIVGDVYSCRVSATLKPTTTGKHYLSFFSVGPGKLSLDGKVLIDQWNWTKMGDTMYDGAEDEIIEIDLQAGKTYNLVSEFTNEIRPLEKQAKVKKTHAHGGVRIGFAEVETRDLLQEAVEVAKAADVAVVIVGLDAEWESEGYDRPDMHLPKDGTQDRLIEAVRKANPNTIVVVQTGSPVTMPWADSVPAVLQAWYQGQEAGNALADVLFGKANPSGKLPTSFPVRLEDTPTFHNFPGENREVFYGEGVYLGYRHYETVGLKPHWPFGHGLSYTKFEIGDVKLGDKVLKEDGSITVSVPVTNVGKVEGAEVVQVYVRDVESRISRPYKELAGFAKVFLKPGETKEAKVTIDKYSGGVGYFDISLGSDGRGRWIVEDGEFEVLVGSSSVDIRGKASFEAPDSFQWVA